MYASHLKPAPPGKRGNRLIIRLRRAELLCKLRRSQVAMVIGAAGIIELVQEVGQCLGVAQGELDGQIQPIRARKSPGRLQMEACDRLRDMAMQNPPR